LHQIGGSCDIASAVRTPRLMRGQFTGHRMIRYSLTCAQSHEFDSWFQSADAWEKLSAAGMVACAVCGSTDVSKALMAPAVRHEPASLTAAQTEAERALAALRQKIETESDYVGLSFAAEARAMHEGRTPERSIYGEARLEEARALLDDGIPVAPLPFMPRNRSN
jgi:hypothetical protein